MIEDMTIRNFDGRTQQSYLRTVRACCRYCDRGPAELTFEDVRRYQLHLAQCGLAPARVNGAMVALRFFFRVTMKRREAVDYIPIVRQLPPSWPGQRAEPAGGRRNAGKAHLREVFSREA